MLSKCGSCNAVNLFELKETTPDGSRFKFFFIQCKMCGVPVGVLNYFNDHDTITNTQNAVKDLENKIQNIDYNVRQIINGLNMLRK
jgi:hypothetical protein